MKKLNHFIACIIALTIFSQCMHKQKIQYPVTKKVDTVDVYFGVKVPDPYRWLEDDKSEETAAWVKAQNAVTDSFLNAISFRPLIKERLTKIWNYPRYSAPFREGKHYFFYKNDGMQNQSVLYIKDSLNGEPRVFLDPNKLSEDGTVALSTLSVSNDGNYLAYGIARGGSDWNEYYVMDVNTGKQLNDKLEWIKFSSIAWKGNGFFYSRYDAPKGSALSQKNEFHKIYFHKIGDKQENDKLIYEDKRYPLRNYGAGVTEDERFFIISETESTNGNNLMISDLNKNPQKFIYIGKNFRYDYDVIDNVGNKLLILTNHGAPKYKLIAVDFDKPDSAYWEEIIPEKEEVLQGVSLAGGKIIARYMKDAYSKAFVYSLDGKSNYELALPGIGTMSGFSGKKEDHIGFYVFTSFTIPTTIYKYDLLKNESIVYNEPEVDFDPDAYETKQVFYTSKDGTKIPMFIFHKKGLVLDGNNPTLLYGYGGFNVSLTPSFSVSRLIFLENGGVYAIPNLRGGGEYGEKRHRAGTKLQKQNVFDDFIAAAEYLIKEKYTSPKKLAISGGSNGGLLVGACMLQRPDLFRVALPAVGVLDMLRFHKFTIGWAWVDDYGSSEDSTQFHYLYKYSPLHNIKEGVEYPATLVTTADHDDRVVPAHSFKFIATLQEKYKGNNPVLIRIETKAGHGAGKPTSKQIEEMADVWSFVFYNMDVIPKY